MNRVFQVVWSPRQGLWAVASELARGLGKSATQAPAVALAVLSLAGTANADCAGPGGGTITCTAGTPQTFVVIGGYDATPGGTVDVQPGAVISTTNLPAISMGDNGTILVQRGATVENNAAPGATGHYGTGANTIEFRAGTTLTIEEGARVLSNGTAYDAEAINAHGSGNLIVNHGEVRSQAGGAAIWLEPSSGSNTVVNGATGVIAYTGAAGDNILAASGTMAVDFTNQGRLIGALNFADGDDALHVHTGSSITGGIDGGGGNNLLTLDGTGTDTFAHALSNFQALVKRDAGTWTFGNALPGSGITSTRVAAGTLILGADASSYTGSMTVDAGGTLQTPAEFAPLSIAVDGLVRFAQPTDATYTGLLSGSGGIEKTGAGRLVLSGTHAYSGATTVVSGTLKAGASGSFSVASAHTVSAGATLDTGGFDQRVAALHNAGTVNLLSASAGSTLTVTGAYVGQGGTLNLGTVLGGSNSLSDRLVLSGPGASASGRTTVRITNLGGLGALTTGNGIEVVSARNGATTTAQTTRDAFTLANGHVDAGAYEYRLHAADAQGAGESWFLRSTTVVQPPVTPVEPVVPGTPADPVDPVDPTNPADPATPSDPLITVKLPLMLGEVPTYRAEVPLFAALPAQLRQSDLAMLGNLHRRLGDEDAAPAGGSDPAQRRGWARAVYSDLDIRQDGIAAAYSRGHVSGLQAGTDLLAGGRWRAGVYVGVLDGGADVSGNARGTFGRIGSNDLRSRYLGAYATWMDGSGLYADAVVQGGSHRYTVRPDGNASAAGKGDSFTASIETGKSFALAGRWTVEPQAQLIYQRAHFDAVPIAGAVVRQDADAGWIGRLGVRVKGDFATGAGRLQPYARLNLYRASAGADVAEFVGPAGSTRFASAGGYGAAELAGGFTLAVTPAASVYGELGRVFALGGDARVKSSVQGSIGVKLRW
ncbi:MULTISPECIES: autotransporter outer membrane beta-barrel domain-containing protein [unclassified Variovorax]|uniref:autotransporter family protein n=1 Tax=unclassified Variovorax TaxID=663243 RepID=UPI00076CF993|nr:MULTISPECIES: autotransporter outer membrane beta-barrel domain-containing protein [unclassified Variovorax]KWT72471.1 autotransporter [Variovorax sp. WDL1]PNG47489.1 Outer membrane protein IcsA autotransporter [Variovorax sp. B2]PNG47860.1 Outer membrane protein IcsA autotransporter [Variovorax sp. B4]VTV15404.1 Outer membrane protein IcsA autotransporter precursor [Variovorax sp. WDL1]